MTDIKTGCGSCAASSDEDAGVVPEAYPLTQSPMPTPAQSVQTTTCSIRPVVSACATKSVVTQCSCCPQPDQPLGCIKLLNTVSMPACQTEADFEFAVDVSKLAAGLNLWAQGVGFLRIISILSATKLRVKNLCESNVLSPGESISAGTCFAWGIPYAPVASSNSNNTGPFLDIPGFIVPATGACAVAKVSNAAGMATGQVVSLAGYNYRIGAQIDATTFSLCNDGNGAAANSVVDADANCDGTLDWPIVVQTAADVCTGSSVSSGVVVGCTGSGLKKIVGTSRCDVLRWNPTIAQWGAEKLFTSANAGAHYLNFDPNTCEWSLVYAPDLLGGTCTKLKDGLNLDPSNTTNLYAVDLDSTTGISVSSVLTIGGLEYDVVTIIVAGTPGKVRLRPRFTVTTPTTIAAGTSVCVSVDQCPPFAGSSYPAGIGVITEGSPVFCAGDGLRTFPPSRSTIGATPFDIPAPININAIGAHDSAEFTVTITNPSAVLPAHVHLNFTALSEMTINQDGTWRHEILSDHDALATTIVKSHRIRIPDIAAAVATDRWSTSNQLVYNEVFGLIAGQVVVVHFKVRMDTTNASAQAPAAEWETLDASCHYSVNSYIP